MKWKMKLSVLALVVCAGHAMAASYSVTMLAVPEGSGSSYAEAINDAGQVVGAVERSDSPFDATAMLWSNDRAYAALGSIGTTTSARVFGINQSGQMVGASYGAGLSYATRWVDGQPSMMVALGRGVGSARDINDAGVAVGSSPLLPLGGGGSHATMWDGDRTIDLGLAGGRESKARAINNAGQVVGDILINKARPIGNSGLGFYVDTAAVLWSGGQAVELGKLGNAYVSSTAVDINGSGQIVGTSKTVNEWERRATLWQGNQVIDLGAAGFSASEAVAINNAGQILGNVWTFGEGLMPPNDTRGVLWDKGLAVDLSQFLDPTLLAEGWLVKASAINNAGLIVGSMYRAGDASRAILLTPVPEPATFASMLIGLMAVGGLVQARRRRV